MLVDVVRALGSADARRQRGHDDARARLRRGPASPRRPRRPAPRVARGDGLARRDRAPRATLDLARDEPRRAEGAQARRTDRPRDASRRDAPRPAGADRRPEARAGRRIAHRARRGGLTLEGAPARERPDPDMRADEASRNRLLATLSAMERPIFAPRAGRDGRRQRHRGHRGAHAARARRGDRGRVSLARGRAAPRRDLDGGYAARERIARSRPSQRADTPTRSRPCGSP